jgi:hypothetical protein
MCACGVKTIKLKGEVGMAGQKGMHAYKDNNVHPYCFLSNGISVAVGMRYVPYYSYYPCILS